MVKIKLKHYVIFIIFLLIFISSCKNNSINTNIDRGKLVKQEYDISIYSKNLSNEHYDKVNLDDYIYEKRQTVISLYYNLNDLGTASSHCFKCINDNDWNYEIY